MSKIIAIIPARAGSKGVPDKNFRKIAGKTLIQHSIESAMELPFDDIYLSTDSKKYALVGKKLGVKVRRRSDIACSDIADGSDILLDLIYSQNLQSEDVIVVFLPTSPYRQKEQIAAYWTLIPEFKKSKYNSMRTAFEMSETVYKKYFHNPELGMWEPIYEGMAIEDCDRPRQQFKKSYSPAGFFDCTKVSAVVEYKAIYPAPIMAIKTPRTFEIDNESDFELVKWIMENKND